ncbi:unnamed protein product [Rhizoctonia solani]|uniref:Protein kinase domain-containing protein n=1 Tax=Rhizoctonia solani TaxID=456999 RepID=A0A8H2ZZC8_9AGAM|nr:unnamed protein product [Rhizoctonia solani]
MDEHDVCLRIVNGLGLNESEYCIGTSKILFRAGVLAKLNTQRDIILSDIFSRFQAAARRLIARRQFVASAYGLLGGVKQPTWPTASTSNTYPRQELYSPVLPESALDKSYPTGWTGVPKEHQAPHRPAKAITVRDEAYSERARASSAPNAVHPRGTTLNHHHPGLGFPNDSFTSLTGADVAREQTRSPTPTNFPGFPYYNQYGSGLGELHVLLTSVEQVISPASTRLSPTPPFDDTYKWETPIVLSKRGRSKSPSDDFWTDTKKRKFEPTYDAQMAERLSTISSLGFPPLETAHPSPSFYPSINPPLKTTQDTVMPLSPPHDPRIAKQLEQSGQRFVTRGGQVVSSVYDQRFQFERSPNDPTPSFDDTYKREIALSKRGHSQSPSGGFRTDAKKRKFQPTYDAQMVERLLTMSSLGFPPLETAHPSPSFYPNINPLLTTTQNTVIPLSPPHDPRIPKQLEQSGQCFVTPGGQIASSVYDHRVQFERSPNYTAQYRGHLNGVVKSSIQPTQAQLSSLSVRRVQRVKSNEMTPSTMFECLIGHGCLDLRTSIAPSRFSSCRVAEGGFGDVWKGQLTDGINVAIKVLRYGLVREDGPKSIKRAMREIYNWSKLEHKNIHKLLGVTIFQERLGMVSKWMERGTLQQYLCKSNDINRYALCYQIAEGVAYLHSAGVNMIHGDLKASNILVSSDGILELTDFDYSIISDCSLVFSATTRLGGGTLRWMAPELVIDEEPTERNTKTDIYALGMETITNALPYSECQRDAQIYGKLSRRQHPKRAEEHFPANEQGSRAWELLVQCWDYDPFSRPAANQVLDTLARWTSPISDTEQL